LPSPDQKLPDGTPIAADADGTPIAFPALGFTLQLEPPTKDDEPAWEQAMGELTGWLGPMLSWTSTSAYAPPRKYRPGDLDYIASYPSMLAAPPGFGDPEADDAAAGLHAVSRDDYAVLCHGGARSNDASAYGVRFFAELATVEAGAPLSPCCALRATVPLGYPIADLRARVLSLAKQLRVRWGVAGLTYAAWEPDAWPELRAAAFAHARRHPGFDIAELSAFLPEWHESVRTVGWLTILGPSMRERLGGLPPFREVVVEEIGPLLVAQAGREPQPGDVNRLQIPTALAEIDSWIAPLRPHVELHFGEPWTETTTHDWLTRFERRSLG